VVVSLEKQAKETNSKRITMAAGLGVEREQKMCPQLLKIITTTLSAPTRTSTHFEPLRYADVRRTATSAACCSHMQGVPRH
jgi:hypothetical protein